MDSWVISMMLGASIFMGDQTTKELTNGQLGYFDDAWSIDFYGGSNDEGVNQWTVGLFR